jgi:hypothetical protein
MMSWGLKNFFQRKTQEKKVMSITSHWIVGAQKSRSHNPFESFDNWEKKYSNSEEKQTKFESELGESWINQTAKRLKEQTDEEYLEELDAEIAKVTAQIASFKQLEKTGVFQPIEDNFTVNRYDLDKNLKSLQKRRKFVKSKLAKTKGESKV